MRYLIIVMLFASLMTASELTAPICLCPASDENGVLLQFDLQKVYSETFETDYGTFQRYYIPTGGYTGAPGSPCIPTWSTLIAIPPRANVRVELVKAEWETVNNVTLYPVQDPLEKEDFTFDASYYENGTYPDRFVGVGEPAIMRDLRVVPVDFYPYRYDSKSKTLLIAKKMTVRAIFEGENLTNSLAAPPTTLSEAFDPIYRAAIANYWFYRNNLSLRRGTLLYIIRDIYVEEFASLWAWKQKEGYKVRYVEAYHDIGGGASPTKEQIFTYIQTAFNTWEYPPDYVILGGDVQMGLEYLMDYTYDSPFAGDLYASDHKYSLLAGDDYLADVIVGRISVDSENELLTYCAKVIGYETNPLRDGSGWLLRGIDVAANCCGTPQPTTPRLVTLWQRELAIDHGYSTDIDTFYCYGYTCPRGASAISSYLNTGAAFVNYRGWAGSSGWIYPSYQVSNVNGLSNGWKLPIVTSIVCGSGDFNGATDPCFGEAWIRAGTPTTPKGGAAFYGATDHSTHTKWNNPNSEGFWWGFFEENLQTFGQCVLRGKLTIYLAYPDDRAIGMGVDHYNYIYNIIAEPSLNIWKGIPHNIATTIPGSIAAGQTHFEVSAFDGGAPLEGAVISAWFYEGDPIVTEIGADGTAIVSLPASITTSHDSFSLVVTDYAHIPVVRTITISPAHSVVLDSMMFGSPVATGRTVPLRFAVKNNSAASTDITVKIVPTDYYDTTAGSGSVTVSSVAAGGTAISSSPIPVVFVRDLPDSEIVNIVATLQYSAGVETVAAQKTALCPSVICSDVTIAGDGILNPNETANVTVTLKNIGSFSTAAATVTFSPISLDSHLTVLTADAPISAITYGDDGNVTVSVQADSSMINGVRDYIVAYFDDGYLYSQIFVPITIGSVVASTFGGPDAYGYYCYDNTDLESGRAPVYNWIELDPALGGTGTDLGFSDDQTSVIDLPFTFRYYGVLHSRLSICSNGWVSPGEVWTELYYNFYNRPLPDPSGPWGMICPFWDDLDPSETGKGVYYKYFPDDFLFVIEWVTVNTFDRTTVEKFELVLRDRSWFHTPTYDNEFVFQYFQIADIDTQTDPDDIAEYATVGIENPDQTVGTDYTFCGILANHAAPLATGRAILWTTRAPRAIDTTKVTDRSLPFTQKLDVFPNPFNPSLQISYELSHKSDIDLQIIDFSGKVVETIANGTRECGKHNTVWNGKDAPSGIYFVVLKGDGFTISKKAILLR
jgi:hypothetical protein